MAIDIARTGKDQSTIYIIRWHPGARWCYGQADVHRTFNTTKTVSCSHNAGNVY